MLLMKFFKPLLSLFILNSLINHEIIACDRKLINMEFRYKNAAGIQMMNEYFGVFYKKHDYVEQHQETVTYDFSHLKQNLGEKTFNVFELNEYCDTFLNRKNRCSEIIKYYIENFEKIHSDVSEPSKIIVSDFLKKSLNVIDLIPEDSGCPREDVLKDFMGYLADKVSGFLDCEPMDIMWNPLEIYTKITSPQKHWFIFINDLRSQLFRDELNDLSTATKLKSLCKKDWFYEGELMQAYTDFNFSYQKLIDLKIVRNINTNEIILLGSYEYVKTNVYGEYADSIFNLTKKV